MDKTETEGDFLKFYLIFVTTLTIPIFVLNTFGGIVGFVWLAFLGEWGIIFSGIIFAVFSAFFISIALLPMMLLAPVVGYFTERGIKLGVIFTGLINTMYLITIIGLFSYWVFNFYTQTEAAQANVLPFALWSFAVATAPWLYMASKEDKDSFGTFNTLFFTEIALMVVGVLIVFGVNISDTYVFFYIIMLCSLIVSFYVIFKIMPEEKAFRVSRDKYDEAEVIDKSNESEDAGQSTGETQSNNNSKTRKTSAVHITPKLYNAAIAVIKRTGSTKSSVFEKELQLDKKHTKALLAELEQTGIIEPPKKDGSQKINIHTNE